MDRFLCKIPKNSLKRSELKSSPPNLQSSDSSRKKSKVSISSSSSVQMYLDFGQKGFNESITCPSCGLLFIKNDIEDFKRHEAYCAEVNNPPIVHNIKGMKQIFSCNEDEFVVEINPSEHNQKQFFKKLITVIVKDLGSYEEFVTDSKLMYLFIINKSIAGCLVPEEVSHSQCHDLTHLEDLSNLDPKSLPPLSDSSTITSESSHSSVYLGVKVIWVHKKYRGMKYAQKLIDIARQQYIFGKFISINEVAFSQPTSLGLAFAKKYCHQDTILCYT